MQDAMKRILDEMDQVISGKRPVIGRLLCALVAGGHVLLDDVPGVGKTTLAVTLGKAMNLDSRRIQFTPDVLPSDIAGFTMYDRASGTFLYRPGVVSQANLLLGDEINRTSSRTQAALLEAMEEKQVTVDGDTHPLPVPFLVIATQNNVGGAGTQPLPYAQMDRFMVRLTVGYPDVQAQVELLRRRQGQDPADQVKQVVTREQFLAMQQQCQQVTAKDPILEYIARLTQATREHEAVDTGVSPRGALQLDRMAKAWACSQGRDYVIPQDVQDVFQDVCGHRLVLNGRARLSGITAEQVLDQVLHQVPAPDWSVGQ